MDGLEFLGSRRDNRALSGIPVIVLTGQRGMTHKARDLDADIVLEKPVKLLMLVDAIHRLVDARSNRPAIAQIYEAYARRCFKNGSMDFDEICRVVPWINMAHDVGIDIYAPQVAHPRVFKTHSTLDEAPKGGRYVIVVRDPGDALLSDYHFFEGMFFESGSVTLEAFARGSFIPRREIWRHILSFWDRRADEDVLPLCYESMKADLPRTIERVANFVGIPLDDELREIVLRQSDIRFMQEHKEQGEDHLTRNARSAAMRLPPDACHAGISSTSRSLARWSANAFRTRRSRPTTSSCAA